MKFLFPAFLFALFAVVVPIIIHLFSFKRYKTVYFSNVSFLNGIKKESQKQSRLKQLLVLLARILTLTFLVFAFARPYIPVERETKQYAGQLVAVYVDNSFSMNALSEQGKLLDVAKKKALEICMACPGQTKFRLFTNDLKPRHQHMLNKEQFVHELSEIQTSPAVVPLSLIYNRFVNLKKEDETDSRFYAISDFQRSVTDVDKFLSGNVTSCFFPLVPNENANLYIDSCWVEVPAHRLGQEETIYVKIKNTSKQDYQNLPLRLFLNDSLKSITNFSVAAQNEVIAALNYKNNKSGLIAGRIEITDYPFTHDNNFYISYTVEKNLTALAVFNDSESSKEGLKYLEALFKKDDYILLDEMNEKSLQVNRLKKYNCIFLLNPEKLSSGFSGELAKVAYNGVSVVLFPELKENITALNNLFLQFGANRVSGIDSTAQEIAQIEFEHEFYKNVFKKKEENPILPVVKGHFRFEKATRSNEINLLTFRNGDKALSLQCIGNGKIWIFSFPLNTRNDAFARDILFVPTIYNIVLNSLPKQEISFRVGDNAFFDIPRNVLLNRNATFSIENRKTGESIIPGSMLSEQKVRLSFKEQLVEDGIYLIKNDGKTIASMALNYNRKESDFRCFSPKELEALLFEKQVKNATVVSNASRNFSEVFDKLQNGKQLWRWCILLALLFIVAEVLISRLWK